MKDVLSMEQLLQQRDKRRQRLAELKQIRAPGKAIEAAEKLLMLTEKRIERIKGFAGQ